MGSIPAHLKPILTRLNIEPGHWLDTVSKFQQAFGRVAGSITSLEEWRERYNKDNETNKICFSLTPNICSRISENMKLILKHGINTSYTRL